MGTPKSTIVAQPARVAFVYGGFGKRLGIDGQQIDEHELLRNAVPRYRGHVVQKYTLPAVHERGLLFDGKFSTDTGWDDADPEVLWRYATWARHIGIDTLAFNVHGGIADGKPVLEMNSPLQTFLELIDSVPPLMFAPVICTRLPRKHFPIAVPWERATEQYRYSLTSSESFTFMMRYVLESYIVRMPRHCFCIDGKPVVFIYDFVMMGTDNNYLSLDQVRSVLDECRSFALKQFNLNIVLISVVDEVRHAVGAENAGVDMITNYIDLPFFSRANNWPIQDYDVAARNRTQQWLNIKEACRIPFIPSAVSGFDASCRTASVGAGRRLSSAPYPPGNWYPLLPHIPLTADRPLQFRRYLECAMREVKDSRLPFLNFGPLNEMTEQCCLLATYQTHPSEAKADMAEQIRASLQC